MLIGRGPDVPIRLDSARVSAKHALLSLEGQWWRISDLKSRNGIRVNLACRRRTNCCGRAIEFRSPSNSTSALQEIPQPKQSRLWLILLGLIILGVLAVAAVLYFLFSQPAAM